MNFNAWLSVALSAIMLYGGLSTLFSKSRYWLFGYSVMSDTEIAEQEAKYNIKAMRRFLGKTMIAAGILFAFSVLLNFIELALYADVMFWVTLVFALATSVFVRVGKRFRN